MISGRYVSSQPRFRKIMNNGIIVTGKGNIIVLSITINQKSLVGHLSNANENATIGFIRMAAKTFKPVIIAVFLKYKENLNSDIAFRKCSHVIGDGIHLGGDKKIWLVGFSEVETIQKRGSRKMTADASTKKYITI